MNQAKPKPHILQHGLALDNYLRTLLDEVPEANEISESLPELEAISEVIVQPASITVQRVDIPPVIQPVQVIHTKKPEVVQALAVMPEWAQQEFQALFFQVDKLILATPLIDLSRTVKMDRKPTKIPGQPSWFLGLLEVNNVRIGVLDTGQLIFGKARGSQRNFTESPFKHILITQDNKWGLACDEILSMGRLKPDKVRWRTHRQKKAWLIGTVIEELTAIIDVKQLVPHRKHEYQ